MSALVVVWDGLQAVRERDVLKWVPEQDMPAMLEEYGDGTHVSRRTWAKGSSRVEGGPKREGSVTTRLAKVVRCPDCTSMKPVGHRYHAPLLRTREPPFCEHGVPHYTACVGQRVPPPCCWGEP